MSASLLRSRAFTLIELLLAMALGATVVTIATVALNHTRQTAARSRVLVDHAQTAEGLFRTIRRHLEPMHPTSLVSFSAKLPGADGILRTADDLPGVSLTWLALLPSRWDNSMNQDAEYRYSYTWCRLQWSQDPTSGQGRLRFARNTPMRAAHAPTTTDVAIEVNPQPRRDHRRPMNDNALTWMPGATAQDLVDLAWLGDDQDLDLNLIPMHPESIVVEDVMIRWTRRNGDQLTMTAADGVSCVDRTGAVKALGGTVYDDAVLQVIDGMYTDGSDPVMVGRTATAGAERPLSVEIRLVLVDTTPGSSTHLRSDYYVCIPLESVGTTYVP